VSAEGPDPVYVSTGALPPQDRVRALVDEAHARYRPVRDGAPSSVYPALQAVDPDLFGIAVANVHGEVYVVGDAEVAFPLMSVAKPFVLALACDAIGAEEVRRVVGANATGLPFNAIEAVERAPDGRTNPMVNPGAMATAGLLPGTTDGERWGALAAGLSAFAGHDLALGDEVLASARATNHVNRALAWLLHARGVIRSDPDVVLDLYTRQSCLLVSARDLAVMGATLADGGVNPLTGARVVSAAACRHALGAMATAGLYETSGDWLFDVGIPGKSGIGGGIVTVAPGKGGLGTFAPPLDAAGNSVRGQLVARFLSRALGLDVFASEPVRTTTPAE
jgi:glutaminase